MNKSNLLQALKFTLFSISAGVIQVVSFTLINELLHWPYWPAYLISLVLSILWNFTLNRRFTFQSAANVPIAMAKIFGFYLVFNPLSTYLGALAEGSGVNEYRQFYYRVFVLQIYRLPQSREHPQQVIQYLPPHPIWMGHLLFLTVKPPFFPHIFYIVFGQNVIETRQPPWYNSPLENWYTRQN